MSYSDCATESIELLDAVVETLGGQPRPNQQAMTSAVADALNRGRHLAVQAGTGTGKSLAYLVPAILHAQRTDSCVIVSTATIALQQQLVNRDLPNLVRALGDELDTQPSFAMLKGRSNYLCQRKFSEDPSVGSAPELGDEATLSYLERQAAAIAEWAEETETGDRDDLPVHANAKLWAAVSTTSQECVGASKCPFGDTCFAERARRRAREADIVVTNHAMLAINSLTEASILPEHDCVIIDEAHELESSITSSATETITANALKLSATKLEKLDTQQSPAKLADLASSWDDELATAKDGRWIRCSDTARGLLEACRAQLVELAKGLRREAMNTEATEDDAVTAERIGVMRQLDSQAGTIARILTTLEEPNPAKHQDVVFLERRPSRREESVLNVAPISIAEKLRESLFADSTVVLTSATLMLNGSFHSLAEAWGLPEGSWDGVNVGSPFNPRENQMLYCPSPEDIPEPGDLAKKEERYELMAQLIDAVGGRTLGLFTSWREMNKAAEYLRRRLDYEILVQGDDSDRNLIDAFTATESTCLLGVRKYWQGVDIPGKTLSLVLIDKIPFPWQNDPIVAARMDKAKARGRNGFLSVLVPAAALLLAQGNGRLLRSATDKGMVAILDPRMHTQRYGEYLHRSLPPLQMTWRIETVLESLSHLRDYEPE